MGNAPGRDRRRSDDVGAAAAGGGDLDVGHVPPLLLAKHSTADSAYSFQQRPRRVSAAAAAGGGVVMTAAAVGSVLEEEPLTLPPTRRRDSGGAPEPRSPRQPHPPLKQQHSAPAETFSSTGGVGGVDQGDGEAIGCRLLPLVVEYVAARDALEVRLCASFTDWKPQLMAVSERDAAGDVYMSIFNLPIGRHEYRFLVDGVWRVDRRAAQCPDVRLVGVTNNYRLVGSDDLAACDAMTQLTGGGQGGSATPPGSYCQTVPPYRPWSAQSMQPPPALPPHLLQVILNKDTPLSCEPTLLPAPNHVMLNHLYALSIKEGVMVLSATHRYRKKYVTTLLYKPV